MSSDAAGALIASELKTILSGIKVVNGYWTDAGLSVHRGFYAHVLEARSTQFPALIIHPGTELATSVRGGGKNSVIRISIPIVIAVEILASETAYDDIPRCTADVRKAVYTAREQFLAIGFDGELEVGIAEPSLSDDSKYALVALTVSLKVQENYEA